MDISDDHIACGTAEEHYEHGIAIGRSYCGVAIIWNKILNAK